MAPGQYSEPNRPDGIGLLSDIADCKQTLRHLRCLPRVSTHLSSGGLGLTNNNNDNNHKTLHHSPFFLKT